MSFFCLYVEQTEVIAAAAAGVAAEGLSPEEAKAQAENAAHLSVALAENAIVILMLVEDHLRSQGQHFCTSLLGDNIVSSTSMASLAASRSNSLGTAGKEHMAAGASRRSSLSSDAGGLPLDVCNTEAICNCILSVISVILMKQLFSCHYHASCWINYTSIIFIFHLLVLFERGHFTIFF